MTSDKTGVPSHSIYRPRLTLFFLLSTSAVLELTYSAQLSVWYRFGMTKHRHKKIFLPTSKQNNKWKVGTTLHSFISCGFCCSIKNFRSLIPIRPRSTHYIIIKPKSYYIKYSIFVLHSKDTGLLFPKQYRNIGNLHRQSTLLYVP